MITTICDSCLEEIQEMVGDAEPKHILLAYAKMAGHMIPDHLCWDTEDPDPTTRCVCSCHKGGE